MAIEKIGDDAAMKKQVTCKRCGSILTYLLKDVVTKTHTDYGGGSDSYSFIKCPDCGEMIYVKDH